MRRAPVLTGAGTWIGGGTVFVAGPCARLTIQPAWGLPIRPGHRRMVIVTSLDAVVPPFTVSDGENVYQSSAVPVPAGSHVQYQQPDEYADPSPPAVVESTVAIARIAVPGDAPIVEIIFDPPASSPSATVHEWAAE